MATTIILVDDAPILTEALADLLASDAAFEVVGVAGDADSAASLAATHRPDVAIVDVRMPGGGPAATEAIQRVSPHTQVLAYSAHEERHEVLEMVRAGAVAYLSKDTPPQQLLDAITAVTRGEPRFSPSMATAVIDELGVRLRAAQTWTDWATARRRRVARILDEPDLLATALQPIFRLRDRRQVGAEALARFDADADGTQRGPDDWFADAWDVGCGIDLDMLAVRRALRYVSESGGWLSINVSPDTLLDTRLDGLIAPVASRLVLELTEHAAIDDYPQLTARLDGLRAHGVRIAIDDVGAGFASLRHIISIRPDIIKLDASLTWAVPGDRALRTLTSGLVSFAAEMAATVVAEGIETDEQLQVMTDLGVDYGQGYLLGRPEMPADTPAASREPANE